MQKLLLFLGVIALLGATTYMFAHKGQNQLDETYY